MRDAAHSVTITPRWHRTPLIGRRLGIELG
jgi:hypothetical protein